MRNLSTEQLRRVQARLKALGFEPGPIDGVPGPMTSAAIIAFKKSVNLKPRDKVGPVTLRMLFEVKTKAKGVVLDIPPLARPLIQRLGWHEGRNTLDLLKWFRAFGKVLGNPKQLPWCGEGAENAALEMFPSVPVPSNPFFAQDWRFYGVDAGGPLIGSFGIIRWNKDAGHIGVVANYDRKTGMVTLLGCNQKDQIRYDSFHIRHFIAFRVPPSEAGKIYAPFAGTRPSSGYGATR
nr:peptidoglycan-binding protein [uncultured Cohaesibacter sp.]